MLGCFLQEEECLQVDPCEVEALLVASQCVEEAGSAEDRLEEVDLCLEEVEGGFLEAEVGSFN